MNRLLKILKRTAIIVLSIVLLLSLVTFFYMQQAQFGKAPSGERLDRIEKSPHYKDGSFHNAIERPTITPGYSIWGELYKTLFKKNPRTNPVDPIPSVKTNLLTLPPDSNVLIWFGHSSCFIQVDGKRILIDPIFSAHASPLPWGVTAYAGSDIYSATDMPEIDYLVISHDHYDHLDYKTVVALKDKVKHVVCGLGVGAHFEYWGYALEQIIERDWNEKVDTDMGITIYTLPSHHDSGRGFVRGKTLWMSYLIETASMKIYYSGDGGYDSRFNDIGNTFGPIDLAIMETGQYDKAWQSVHNLPEQVIQAAQGLKAMHVLPVHHSKFTLGKHPWDEPLEKISELSSGTGILLMTPKIGEVVRLNDSTQQFTQWWKGVR